MRLLLDTHILLWGLDNDPSLSSQARTLMTDPENDVFVSPISLWEIAIKVGLGKLAAAVDKVHKAALESGFIPLPFTFEHAGTVAHLPDHHRDPFDRALIAQARFEPLILLTHDELLASYGDMVLLV